MADRAQSEQSVQIDRIFRVAVGDETDYDEGGDPRFAESAAASEQPVAVPPIATSIERLLWLILMTSANPPVTELMPPKTGDSYWGADTKYKLLIQNDAPREIRVQIFMEFGGPGEGIKLSLSANSNDTDMVDSLINTANSKSESVGIVLKSKQSLWGAAVNGVPLTAGTIVRARIFDAQNFLSLKMA